MSNYRELAATDEQGGGEEAADKRPRAQTCTSHCSELTGCGQHFHGLAAYDRHLQRIPESEEGETRRYRLEHLTGEEAGLDAWTTTGRCDLTPGSDEPVEPVTIWQMPGTAERLAKAGFGGDDR
jgi:hypothetical protein